MLTYTQRNVRARAASAAWPISARCRFAVPTSRLRAFTNVWSVPRSGARTDKLGDEELRNTEPEKITVAQAVGVWQTLKASSEQHCPLASRQTAEMLLHRAYDHLLDASRRSRGHLLSATKSSSDMAAPDLARTVLPCCSCGMPPAWGFDKYIPTPKLLAAAHH